ncbi:unnamed protein product [Didymodactylos carnosus]|uniref:YHYH domain-containing protein n=1 Tax=Didymodactylos carnosus TaxID=1234261 RepID=A0A816F5V7_9BILA|nr:unnamed protein product [Didymodactylos carnosus]CAF4600517.1 unnamed protein product [Didymodactylos carnosus]
MLVSSDLDTYHGHTGVTADYPNGIYHYHITADAPYINGSGFYGTKGTAQPQGAPPKLPSKEDRLKHVSEALDNALHLTATQKQKVLAAYGTFFDKADKMRNKDEKMQPPPPPPPPPPQLKREDLDKLVAERDAQVKQALDADTYKKYTEVEKTLHPPRPPQPSQLKN